jgi:acetyl-CoA synthetase
MLRGIWGDPERFKDTYWSRFETMYFAGDGAKKDEDGDIWLLGRVDDVMNVSGHRLSTTEIESALVSHPAVAEAAVVAAPDDERGSVVRAVVVLREGHAPSADLTRALQDHVKGQTAPYKYPRRIDYAAELPKTASGKIRRAALREAG